MAKPVVSFVLYKIGDLLINEAKCLCGVKAQVENANSELAFILSFLKDANANVKEGSKERLRNCVAQINDYAYDLEDAIENFILKVAYQRSNISPIKYLEKTRLARILTRGIEAH